MIRIPNPDEEIDSVSVNAYRIELVGEVSQQQMNEIESNQLKIAKLRLKNLRKEKKQIREIKRQFK